MENCPRTAVKKLIWPMKLPARLRGKVYTNVPLCNLTMWSHLKFVTLSIFGQNKYYCINFDFEPLWWAFYSHKPPKDTKHQPSQYSRMEKFLKNGSVADSNHRHGRCGGCCPGKGFQIDPNPSILACNLNECSRWHDVWRIYLCGFRHISWTWGEKSSKISLTSWKPKNWVKR